MRKMISVVFAAVLFWALPACNPFGSSSEPTAPVAPITLNGDLMSIDVCNAIPQADIQAVIGQELTSVPQPWSYYDTPGTNGCAYDAGTDANGNVYFGYIIFTPVSVYNNQPLVNNVEVSGIGKSAYFNNGADARQLWVQVNDEVAFVIAFGDQPKEEGSKALAKLLLAAIK